MEVIYRPKGRALEYAPLAVNLYTGCPHGCTYCFAPNALRVDRDDFRLIVRPRKNIIGRLEKDAIRLENHFCDDEILLCFACDPYPKGGDTFEGAHPYAHLTRSALQILGHYGLQATVLTKGGVRAMRDFDLLKKHDFAFGTTISFRDDTLRQQWEPNAASVQERVEAIIAADAAGIRTWVSLEPVVDPDEAIAAIRLLSIYVDYWKVGKLNHSKEIEDSIDWAKFYVDVTTELNHIGAKYYIKNDLAAYSPERVA